MPARTSASSSSSSSSSSSDSSDSLSRSITSSFLYTTLVTLSCVCLFGVGVDGTHFQFGSITWTRTSPVNITNPLSYEYTFSMISGWRQCYQPFVEANGGRCPTIGNIVNVGSYFFFQGTTSPVGANFAGGTEISDWTNYGQIPRPSTTNVPITAAEKAARIPNTAFRANVVVQQLQVSADDPGSNWFVGTNTLKIKLGQVNSNLPAGTGNTLTLPFTLMFMHCCRISTLLDGNNDRLSFVGTIVNQGINSPVTTSRIREYAFLNVPIVYSIPGTQLDRHPLRYSFTPATSNGLQSQLVRDAPSNQISNGAPNVDPITGKLTWTPTRLGLVAMQFSIKDTVTDSVIVLDIVFQVTDALNAPEFISPIPSYDFSVAPRAGQFPGFHFPIGISRSINIRAQDSARNTPRGISAMSTITAAEGITFTFIPNRNEPNGIGTGQLTYTAKMNSTDINVCFSCHNFLGVPVPSVKQYCITLIPGGNVIVATGIVRDFHRKSINDPRDVEQVFANLNNLPDFDIGQNRDTTVYVTDRLDENGLPIFKGGNGITITNTSYQDWWKTDTRYADFILTTPQQQTQLSNRELTNHTIVLTSGVSTDSRIYTFRSENFNPIDGQLFGNELDDNNYFFTYEIHTFIDYRGGEILEFWSSDDLFIYFDYVLEVALPGTGNGSIKKQIIALDDTAMGKRKVYGKYRCDIFYAQRSRQNKPVIQIQLPATQSTTFRPPITTRPPTTLPPTSTYPPTDIPTTQPPTDPPTEPPTSTPTPVVPTIPVPVPTTFTWINPKERTWIRPLTSSISFVYNNPPHNTPLYVRVQDRTTLITSGTTSSSIQVSADVTLKGSNQLTSMTVEILRDDEDGTPIAADHIYTQVVTRSTFSALAIPDPMPILNAMANSDDVIVPAQACPPSSNTGAIVGGVIAAMSVLIILTNIATHVITKRHQQKVQSTPAPIIETWQANPAITTQEGVMV